MIDPHKKNKNGKSYQIWIVSTLILTIASLAIFASITIYIDPLFHYHAPLEKYEYPINNERYQNDGISRNFEYDSIITGTSMAENFMKSEADQIFNANFIKVPFSGATYKEVNDNLCRAYDTGKNIRYVIRSLDYTHLIEDKNTYKPHMDYAAYLYDDNLFNDLNYVLNKSILFDKTFEVIRYTKSGSKTTDFDIYTNWNANFSFGVGTVLDSYTLEERNLTPQHLTNEERIMVQENIRQNVTDLAKKHPETTFYLFFPPYSICYWDELQNNGQIDWRIDAEQLAIEEILEVPNIKLYSFCTNFDLVCNLDNYKDQGHYGEWVNSWILEWMHNDEYLLTKNNYHEYIETIRGFYGTYNYDNLRK